ncbi:EF-hand calcium-binding domain-containing protein 11 [Lamellibrachia satsuma]|nr:EF-hand calcium-binding domain-containing protein 11 [Lamellibrachia satsuma]
MQRSYGFILGPGPYQITRKLTAEDKNVITLTFHDSDLGHKGYLTREDLKTATVALLGYKPSKYEVDEMCRSGGFTEKSSEQGMTLDKFVKVMSLKMAAVDEDDEIRQTFLIFDSQCRGFLNLEDIIKAFSQVAPHMQRHAIESAFKEIDRDGDGRISYKDFEFMMKYNADDNF